MLIFKQDKDNSVDDEYEKENDKNDNEDTKTSWQSNHILRMPCYIYWMTYSLYTWPLWIQFPQLINSTIIDPGVPGTFHRRFRFRSLFWHLKAHGFGYEALAFVFGLQCPNNWAMKTDTLGAG